MLSFHNLELNKKQAVYLQIVEYVERLIYLNKAENGDILPSRRELAVILEINPNTSQKAFKAMEEQGLIQTNSNSASYLSYSDEKKEAIKQKFTRSFVVEFVERAKLNGMELEQVEALILKYWDECEE